MMSIGAPARKAPTCSSPAATNLRNWLAIAVFVLTFHTPQLQRQVEPPLPQASVTPADLPRFHQVHSYFWRGAAPSFAGLDELKKLGVRTVIDLRRSNDRIAEERKYCGLIGMNYVSLPLGDFVPSLSKQREFMFIINDAATHPANGPVFLHCSHGSDRTGFLTALWRVQHDHWSILEAGAEMLQYGFFVHKFEKN